MSRPNCSRTVSAPDSVKMPEKNEIKGKFFFFADDLLQDMDVLWDRIVESTKNGTLGYYAEYSDNGYSISVYMADTYGSAKYQAIKDELTKIGLDFYFVKYREIKPGED